jgi:hypothetical protein
VLWRINPACPAGLCAVVPDGILTAPVLLIVTLPDTVKLDNVPTEVILGCAAVVTVAADPDMLPVIVFVTVSPVNVPTDVMLGCAAVVTVPAVAADPDTLPVMVFVTVNPDNVPTEVILGCEAVCNVPVTVLALTDPAFTAPLTPTPPVTTNVPELVLVLVVLAVNVVAELAVNDVNAPLPLVLAPMLTLLTELAVAGLTTSAFGLIVTVAPPPLISTLPLNIPVVATSAEPSSEITI